MRAVLGFIVVAASLLAMGGRALATDADGDGHHSYATGGDDCADNDAGRNPSNAEVCDPSYKDEDCNMLTFGSTDLDGDGEVSNACCNASLGYYQCGMDCNDSNPGVELYDQYCANSTQAYVCKRYSGSAGLYGYRSLVSCGGGLTCVTQPNGTGVCR